ncbi:MAG: nuclear transport factor 2 family protein [Burkholderiaceae bacterium]
MNNAVESAALAEALVRDFLRALAERDVERAGALLAPGANIVFPGGAVRKSIDDIVAGSALKYQHVDKRIERVDVLADPTQAGGTIVYCYGTLFGRWLDGTAFEGIRFIDRFAIVNGLITDQQVWNDTAYTRPAV